MRKIFFDTNFLIDLARFRISFDEIEGLVGQYEPCTLDSVVKELEGIASRRTKSGKSAKVALELVKKNNFHIIGVKGKDVDSSLLRLAGGGSIVATNDYELRKGLKQSDTKVIYLRSKKHLEMM